MILFLLPVYNYLRTLILPLRKIDQYLPKRGTIFDLGCGQAVIAKFIAREKNRNIIGVDIDKKRLPQSTHKNLKFECADIRRFNLKGASGVIISDVLHHLNYIDQLSVLANISSDIKKDGVLIVKEIDKIEFIRSRLSRFWDFVFYPKDKIYYLKSKDLKKTLKGFGFKVTVFRPCRLFPGSSTLFVCKKLV